MGNQEKRNTVMATSTRLFQGRVVEIQEGEVLVFSTSCGTFYHFWENAND
jgi:aconitase B